MPKPLCSFVSSTAPPGARAEEGQSDAVDTILFVDVDGVLNVGVNDPGNRPLEFSTANYTRAQSSWATRHDSEHRASIERLVATHRRELGHGEGGTYGKFLSESSTGFSDTLVARLAGIIKAAGKKRMVVMSSTWRLPQHRARVRRLEDAISNHLGATFTFDARTAPFSDSTPEQRLRTIGDFLTEYCEQHAAVLPSLRVLLLEDFHITSLGSWSCNGEVVDCAEAVERYLESRSGAKQVTVKLVHCFDEWTSAEGTYVKVGCGLTLEHVCQANRFLGLGCSFCGRPSSPKKVEVTEERAHQPEADKLTDGDELPIKNTEDPMPVALPLAAGVAWLRARGFFAVNSRAMAFAN
jgi:hypothetical protein